jgi:predicted aconitase
VDQQRLAEALAALGATSGRLGAVSVGTPHASRPELERLAVLCAGRSSSVPFYVNTGRDVQESCGDAVERLEAFGATVVTDTCTYITPIIGPVEGCVMTNSGKWAYYAPGNLGVEVALGTLEDCVESAVRGIVVVSGELT